MSIDAWWLHKPEPSGVDDLEVVERPDPADAVHRAVTVVLPSPPTPEPQPQPDQQPAPRPEPAARPRRRATRRRRAVAPVAAALVTAGVVTSVVALRARDTPAPTPAPAAALPVDLATVTATATSTQDPEGATTYGAANTLDGDLATAWNSDGAPRRSGATSLTYTFAGPVGLRDITVRNGYQKVRRRTGRPPVDLYPANARVHRLRVVTDAGSWTWDLADVRSPQTFTGAAGRTGSVRLEVVSVHASATYDDVALSEVSFTATP